MFPTSKGVLGTKETELLTIGDAEAAALVAERGGNQGHDDVDWKPNRRHPNTNSKCSIKSKWQKRAPAPCAHQQSCAQSTYTLGSGCWLSFSTRRIYGGDLSTLDPYEPSKCPMMHLHQL